jgi:EmrB/QacA subfamily drug resistance transporter
MPLIGRTPGEDSAILSGAAGSPCSASAQRWTLVSAIIGSSMAFVDGTVVNVALPALQRALNADAFQAQWVVESYALFLASLLLAAGALGDHLGRKKIFMIGVALFTAASGACALSGSIGQLIAARAVQGIGAALLVPGSLALISSAYPQAKRGQAIGTWSAFSGITAAIGPVLGGYLVDHYTWVWAFLINLPIGVVLLVICGAKVPESRGADSGGPIDGWGAALATLALAGLVFALIEAPKRGWSSAMVLGAALAGSLALVLFVVVETQVRSPMLPLALFKNSNFTGANVLTMLLYAALGGGLFFLPLNLIQVQGFSASAAGAALLPFIAILFLLSSWAGHLVDRFGPRLPLMVGPVIAALGFLLLAGPGAQAGPWWRFMPAVCVLGLGMAITVAPLTTTVMNSLGSELAGLASGINNAASRTAALLAIAVFGLVMSWAFDATMSERLAQMRLPADLAASLQAQAHKLAGIVLPEGLDAAMALQLKRAIGESFVAGFRWVMFLCTALALLGALGAALLISGKARAP